jgi:DNA primase catalytic subunit
MAKKQVLGLHEHLKKSFSNLQIVYSGRGFHIHVFDPEPFKWNYRKRRSFAKELKKKGFLIDEWVTTGGMRLIRLPYSLHGMVSRIVLPIEINELAKFDPLTDSRCKPLFLKDQATSS